MIRFFNDKRWVYDSQSDVEDIEKDNRKFFDSFCPSLIVPLQNRTTTIGFVVLGPSNTHESYNYEDYDLLKTLAKQAASTIMNAQLAQDLAEAQQMVLMGKIASFVVHDLKNLSSALSLIDEQLNAEREDETLSLMFMQGIEDINILIEKIKNFDPSAALKRESVNLCDIIHEVIETIVLQDNISISFHGTDIAANVDREELKKVLTNLILNASDSFEQGQGEINIYVYEKKERIFIDIADTGLGISQEFIDNHLFRPFQTTKNKGMGIGLYQCKAIVEAHGGKLTVRNNEQKGTVFSIELN